MNNLKLIALLTVIGEETEVSEINIVNECTVEVETEEENAEYKVFTEEEADEAFNEYQEELLEEMGLESFAPWAQEYILNNFVESSWFDEAMKESYEFYIEDIKSEGNRLEEEMEQAGAENEEEYTNYLCDQWESGIEWYKDNFGKEEFSKAVKQNNLIDESGVIDWVKETDGRGSSLSSYNGVELEQDGYYIYRTN